MLHTIRGRASRLALMAVLTATLLTFGVLAPSRADAASSLTATPVPTISGTVAVGTKVTAVPGTWKPAPVTLTYQWRRDGIAIANAVASTYTPSSTDAAHRLTVTVTGRKTGYTTVSKTSAYKIVLRRLTAAPTPSINGTARVGGSLVVVPGTWGPAPVSLSYQWYRGTAQIAGATASTYAASLADLGSTITVRVTGRKAGYVTVTRASAGVGIGGASQLNAGDALAAGQYLQSANGAYTLQMQGDGNLVEYGPSGAIWASSTSGSNHVVMQGDGNLVIYNSSGGAVWSTFTNQGTAGVLALQDDANLVVYIGGVPQWSRGVTARGTVGPSGTQGMSAATLNSTQRTTYPAGRWVNVLCYSYGQTVSGSYGKGGLWHLVVDGNYVADVDVKTGVDGPMAGEPACGGSGTGVDLAPFVAKYNGKTVGTGQCVALIKQELAEVYGVTPGAWGNAVDYRQGGTGGQHMAAAGFAWHTDQSFRDGDILVWGPNAAAGQGAAGHIGTWFGGRVFDQNDARSGRAYNAATQTYVTGFANFWSGGYLGYWRR